MIHSFIIMPTSPQQEFLRAKLNQETAEIPWTELQRFFAGGSLISVADDLDLVEVAARMSADDTEAVSRWIEERRIARVSDVQAQAWMDADASLWTVVVKPWILVQESKPA